MKAAIFVNGRTKYVDIQDQDILTTFTPSNFTPRQVSAEGSNKLSAYLLGIDDKLASLLSSDFSDQFFSSNGIVTYYETGTPFDGTDDLDWYVNGSLQEENLNWQRNVGTSPARIETISNSLPYAVPDGAEFRLRIFSGGYTRQKESAAIVADGITTQFNLTFDFAVDSNLDVHINGVLQREGTIGVGDYTRDHVNNRIIFHTAPSLGARIVPFTHNIAVEDEFFVGGVNSVTTIGTSFTPSSKIDVFINGRLKKEGVDWTRSEPHTINIINGSTLTNSNTLIQTRLWSI